MFSASPLWEQKVRHTAAILHVVQEALKVKGNSMNNSEEPPSALPCPTWKFHPIESIHLRARRKGRGEGTLLMSCSLFPGVGWRQSTLSVSDKGKD